MKKLFPEMLFPVSPVASSTPTHASFTVLPSTVLLLPVTPQLESGERQLRCCCGVYCLALDCDCCTHQFHRRSKPFRRSSCRECLSYLRRSQECWRSRFPLGCCPQCSLQGRRHVSQQQESRLPDTADGDQWIASRARRLQSARFHPSPGRADGHAPYGRDGRGDYQGGARARGGFLALLSLHPRRPQRLLHPAKSRQEEPLS